MKIDLEQFEITAWENLKNSVRILDSIELLKRFGNSLPENHPARVVASAIEVLPSPRLKPARKYRAVKKQKARGERRRAELVSSMVKPMPQWRFLRDVIGTRSMNVVDIADAMMAKGWVFKSKEPRQAALQSIYELKRKGYVVKNVPDPSDTSGKRVLWSISLNANKKLAQQR